MPQRHQRHTNNNPALEPGFSSPARLADLVGSAWAITPSMLEQLQAIYTMHLRGEKIDIHAIEASLGRPLNNQQRSYDVVDGIAVLGIQGAIAPKANLFTQISGGASAQLLQRDLASALEDPRVDGIVLSIDSPGGSVFGSPDLARAVFAGRQVKPIVAHTDGMMASAAYWIGSAAHSIYNSGPTVMVGSIGVVARHINAGGQGVTEITAGAYKRIASDTGPLTKEGRAYMQAQVDYFYEVFVDHVGEHRGVSAEQVLEDMADGRIFIGQQAIDAGLVDGVATLSELIARMADDPQSVTQRAVKPKTTTRRAPAKANALPAPAAAADDAVTQDNQPEPVPLDPQSNATRTMMDKETLEREHTALFNQLQATFRQEGAAAELARITSVRAQALPGHEALIERLAFDGKTSGDQAAAAIVAAEREKNATQARAHAEDAPTAAPAGGAPSDVKKTPTEKAAEAEALAKTKGISIIAALKELGYAA